MNFLLELILAFLDLVLDSLFSRTKKNYGKKHAVIFLVVCVVLTVGIVWGIIVLMGNK